MPEFIAHFKSVQPDLGGSLPGDLIFGIPGKDGGYYTIQITQPDSDTMRLTFTASKDGMEQIDPADILLPKGPKGEPGEVDMDQILRFIAEYLSQNPPQVAEKDPTVPDWAKEETKPSYSKSEVGLGNVDNVQQYSASNPPPYPVASVNGKTGKVQLGAADVGARPSNWMPTAQEVGALPDTYVPPDQTAAQVGADPAGTAAAAVIAHNTSTDSHGDLRLELKAINDRLTAFFDSDNQTLDELSEIVAYITSNKALIDSITTSKVSVADIINNLTTNVANKPLSAAQGVVLKGLIDAVSNSLSNYQPKGDYALRSELPTVPTKVSQLQNDKGYLTEHQDISGKLDADKLPEAINTALAQAKESGEFDGEKGDPGVTPHIGSNGNWYIGSVDTGVKAQGKDGAAGRGIKSIARTSGNGAAGTTDTYTITYTDNTTSTLTVYNGKNGTNGTSVTVESVRESTADGGSNVVTFSDGKTLNVKNGSKGNKGDPGTTPQKGIDFWTDADQEAIVQQVITALGTPVFGRVDENKHITLTGNYADGNYTYSFEDKDGNVLATGEFSKTTAPTYTNILPLAINTDKTPYNGGQGWKTGYRLNSSGAEAAVSDWEVTGYMPVTTNDTIYFKNVQWRGNSQKHDYIGLYNSNFSTLTSTQVFSVFIEQTLKTAGSAPEDYGITLDADNNLVSIDFKKLSTTAYGSVSGANWSNVKYIRFSCFGITDDSIITKNEPIE